MILPFIIGGVFGFAVGCTFKELVINKSPQESPTKPIAFEEQTGKTVGQCANDMITKNDFNLCEINYLFDKYGIELIGMNSFSILLRKMERVTYKNALSYFDSNVSSAEDLYNLLENNTSNEVITLTPSTKPEILISDSYINDLLHSEDIDYSAVNNIVDKVQLLVSFYVGNGLKRFQKTMGPALNQFITDYESKKDVSLIYEEIMQNIRQALSFISN